MELKTKTRSLPPSAMNSCVPFDNAYLGKLKVA